jgi:hypothetical protein
MVVADATTMIAFNSQSDYGYSVGTDHDCIILSFAADHGYGLIIMVIAFATTMWLFKIINPIWSRYGRSGRYDHVCSILSFAADHGYGLTIIVVAGATTMWPFNFINPIWSRHGRSVRCDHVI